MENKEDKKESTKWTVAIELFTQVSGWIVGPIIVALIFGKYLDAKFQTEPWIFIGCTVLAFAISCFGIVKVVKKYMDDLSPLSPKATEDKQEK